LSTAVEDDRHQSSKSLLIPTKSTSSSPSRNKNNRQVTLSIQSTTDDIPPALPSRQPINKKNNVEMPSATPNTPVFKSSSQINDDISILNSRRLSNKEVRKRSVFLENDREK